MPANLPPFGVSLVSFGSPDPTNNVGSLAAATTAYSVITPDKFTQNSRLAALNDTYNITLALLGFDRVNKGYTIGISTPASSDQVVTTGEGILMRIAQPLPTGMADAIAVAVFLQKGSADPQMVDYAYIDPFTDFSFLLMTEPLRSAFTVPQATLAAATATRQIGSRTGARVIYTPFTPTTGGVRRNHKFTKTDYRPDDSPDSQIPVGTGTDLEFSVYTDDLEILAQAIGGDFTEFTDTDSSVVQQLYSNMYSTVANIDGNRALKVLDPPNNLGVENNNLYLGNVVSNVQDFTEGRLKTEAATVNYLLSAANLDRMLAPFRTGIRWSRRA